MQQYHALLRALLDTATPDSGTNSLHLYDWTATFDLASSFPLLTTNPISFTHISSELLWFLRTDLSSSHVRLLNVIGTQEYGGLITRLSALLQRLTAAPPGSRFSLAAVHGDTHELTGQRRAVFHFSLDENRGLTAELYIPAAHALTDWPFAVPSYALFTFFIAHACDLQPRSFLLTVGDTYAGTYAGAHTTDKINSILSRRLLPLPSLLFADSRPSAVGIERFFKIRSHHFSLSPYKTHRPFPYGTFASTAYRKDAA